MIGRRYACPPLLVEPAMLRAYALATNDPNPRYLGEDPIAPPLFAVRLFVPLMAACREEPDLDLDTLRLVHAQQDMLWHAPIRAGETVSLRAELETLAQRRRGCVIAWRTTVHVEEDVRVEARLAVFVHGQKLPDIAPRTCLGRTPRRHPDPVGTPIAEQSMTVAPDQAIRYAAASLDDNPIHLDEDAAKAAGHPTTILHGLCTMAFAAKTLVDDVLEANPHRLRRFSARFSRAVHPGAELRTRVYEAGETDSGRRACAVEVVDERGVRVLSNGWAELDPP